MESAGRCHYGEHLGDGNGRVNRKMAETSDRHTDNKPKHVCMRENLATQHAGNELPAQTYSY